MDRMLNISAYLFTPLDEEGELTTLRDGLRASTRARGLRGTILLAPEGINLFLAGEVEAVRDFVVDLRSDARFADLAPKESWSQEQPFRKMLVKIKREIIRMNHPAIRPADGRAPSVDPLTLRRWLDQGHDDAGREVVMLDTRNAFEVDYGTFENAVDWRLEKFTEFPDAAASHRSDLDGKTVVSFCTGGIRCEKAAIHLAQSGHPSVLQLDGGILTYFEQAGGAHFTGECFVFDEREALSPQLAPR